MDLGQTQRRLHKLTIYQTINRDRSGGINTLLLHPCLHISKMDLARKFTLNFTVGLKTVLIPEHIMLTTVTVISAYASYKGMFEPQITPRRYFTLIALSVGAIFMAVKVLCGRKIRIDFRFVAILITAVCVEEAVYALCQWSGLVFPRGYFKVTGHFDNPAGLTACLCAGCPFALSLWGRSLQGKVAAVLFATLMVMALVVSQSRTGIIVMALLLGNFAMKLYGLSAKRRLAVLVTMVSLMIAVGYTLKRGSADGRLLVWRCSMDMIADSPWTGHGIGAFKRLYMDYQAAFLQDAPDGDYALLADNVFSPFNEYIHLCICFGCAGMTALAISILLLAKSYKKSPSAEKRVAMSSLCCIGGVSLFSYPFTYPFVWVVTGLILWIMLKDATIFERKAIRKVLSIGFIVAGIVVVHWLHAGINAELR